MTNFSIYLLNNKLILAVWHGTNIRFHNVTEHAAISIAIRLLELGFIFRPRLAQFGWIAGRLQVNS